MSIENQSYNITIIRNGDSDILGAFFWKDHDWKYHTMYTGMSGPWDWSSETQSGIAAYFRNENENGSQGKGTGGCTTQWQLLPWSCLLALSMQYGYNHYHNLDKILITRFSKSQKKDPIPWTLAELTDYTNFNTVIGVGNQIHILRELVLPIMSYIGYRTTSRNYGLIWMFYIFVIKWSFSKGEGFRTGKIFNHLALSQ